MCYSVLLLQSCSHIIAFVFQHHEGRDSTTDNVDTLYIDGLVQDCSISIALAMEVLQSCFKWSIYSNAESVVSRFWHIYGNGKSFCIIGTKFR